MRDELLDEVELIAEINNSRVDLECYAHHRVEFVRAINNSRVRDSELSNDDESSTMNSTSDELISRVQQLIAELNNSSPLDAPTVMLITELNSLERSTSQELISRVQQQMRDQQLISAR